MVNQVITVSGSPGAGKTLFAYFLARMLSGKKRVALVCADGMQPGFPLLFPLRDGHGASLGKLLSLPSLEQEDLFRESEMLGDNLMMFSYADAESAQSYPETTDANLHNFFHTLRKTVELIVVDSSCDGNPIDRYAQCYHPLRGVCLLTADGRGSAWYRIRQPQAATLLLRVCGPYNSPSDIQSVLHEKALVLPYCKALTAVYNGVDADSLPLPRTYKKIMARLAGDGTWI